MSASSDPIPVPGPVAAPRLLAVAAILVLIGLAGVVYLAVAGGPQFALWAAVLQGAMVPAWIGIGALAFLSVHAVCGARWTVPLRRIMEGMTSGLWLTLLAIAVIAALGLPHLYEWAYLTGAAREALFVHPHGSKSQWLTTERWSGSCIGAVTMWLLLRSFWVRQSRLQSAGIDTQPGEVRLGVITLVVVALTFTLFTWDSLLTLEVKANSSIWGMYCLAGAVQSFLALLALVLCWLARGPLKGIIRPHLTHDLGTWIIAFSCVWAYLGMCQYAIQYFANLTEETYFWQPRLQGGWSELYVIAALLRFPLPFLMLLSQRVRADGRVQALAGVCILAGAWLDLTWMVQPAFSAQALPVLIPALMVGAGFVGGMLILMLQFWRRHGLVPLGDPRYRPAVAGEHLH